MIKNYKFLTKATMLLLSFLAVPFGMLGQTKITDFSNIVSGTQYYIGATTGGNDFYLSVNGSATTNSIAGTAVTSMDDATPFTFEGSDASWTIQFESGYYLSLKDGKDNGKVQVVEGAVTFTASNQSSNKIRLSKGSYSIQKNNSGTQFGSYGNTQTDIWLMEVPVGLVATTTTIDASGITNTDVYTGTAAGSLTATVTETESGNAVSGATVTWTSSKENVATIDEDGVVTLVAAGTTTITASYEGVSGEFGASSATYELTVTSSAPYEQPTEFEIGLNNALFGTEYTGSVSNITDANPIVGTQDNVTVTYAGSSNHYVNDSQIRLYPSNKLTFEAPEGYEIKEIVFTADGTWSATISADGGTYVSDTKTWTGSATSVLFTGSGSGQCRMSKASITLGLPSSDPIISANNMNIAYDATSGEIAYTINNPVPGTLLQATADADWVSDITVGDEAITFTTTANEANTERVATFTLTYEGAEDKTVTVTQAAAPVIYTTIPDLFAAATSTSTPVAITFNNWVISAVKGSNAYLTDNAGNGLIIYQSGHGFNVNDVLSGTASCNLVTYQGSAELTALTATTEGLTVTADGTVMEQNIAINELGGVNTGALLAYENLTYNGTALVDADNNAIEPYSTLYSYTFEADKVYNVKGIYKQYTTNTQDKKQILPRSADDIEEVTPTEPTVTVNPTAVEVDAAEHDGTITVSCENMGENLDISVFFCEETDVTTPAEYDWITADIDNENNVYYIIEANTATEARTAYMVVKVADADAKEVYTSKLITFTQAGKELPSVTWDLSKDETATASTTEMSWTSDFATMKVEKAGAGTNTNNYYPGSATPRTSTRFYAGSELTIAPKLGYTITKVEFTATSENYASALINSTWTNATAAVDGTNVTNVTVTPTNGNLAMVATIGGTCGFTGVKVYYEESDVMVIEIKKDFTATTFSCDKALDFSNVEGITAFIITDDKGATTQVTKVPAGKGLYIVGAEGDYEVPFLTNEAEAEDVSANWLIPTDGTTEFKSDESVTYYAFGKQNGKEAFYKVPTSGYTPSANKAVLVVNAPASSAKEMIVIGGDVTGIESIENGTIVNDNYYTIDGKLVKGQPTQKGIYVVNGRKVVIK